MKYEGAMFFSITCLSTSIPRLAGLDDPPRPVASPIQGQACLDRLDEPEVTLAKLELQDSASKGNGGRTIPLHKDLRATLVRLKEHTEARRPRAGGSALRRPEGPGSWTAPLTVCSPSLAGMFAFKWQTGRPITAPGWTADSHKRRSRPRLAH